MSGKLKFFRLALLLAFTMMVGNITAQTIKGTVTDSSGEPIIGATVMETGTQNGVVTDLDGNFTLQNVKGKTITISYIGMKTQTVQLAGKTEFSIVLEDETASLNELVVIGYGSVRKKDLTGSVSTVKVQVCPSSEDQEVIRLGWASKFSSWTTRVSYTSMATTRFQALEVR